MTEITALKIAGNYSESIEKTRYHKFRFWNHFQGIFTDVTSKSSDKHEYQNSVFLLTDF